MKYKKYSKKSFSGKKNINKGEELFIQLEDKY